MRIRRFTGADTTAALVAVKRALGPDAVILATRARAEGGVEIVAAVDVDRVTAPVGRIQMPARGLGTVAAAHGGGDAAVAGLDAIAGRLVASGFSAPLAARLAGVPGARSPEALAVALADAIAAPGGERARVTAFVGPTGSGKTTTVAKLAAGQVARGEGRIGLVMADGQRLGAAEQLGAYARLLGLPMRVARDADELRDAVAAMADRDAIYVDTGGVGSDLESAAALRALVRAVPDLATVAVVSASTSATALAHAAARLAELGPTHAVVTKLDEGGGLGTACSWLADASIRLAWLGTGPRVPEDLAAASGATLARWLRAA